MTKASACVVCGQLTTDRYFASATGAQVGSRRPPLPVSMCRTCPTNAQPAEPAAAADRGGPPQDREEAPSQTV